MEEVEISALKDTLCHQYLIMQKLYVELEEEREASATAASEALSMILRLQGEKAVEKMEACQYKRMTEEKMRHAEESLVFFEELLYQKEMEIASLKFQVQDYVEKLSGIVSGKDITSEVKILENLSSKEASIFLHDKSSNGIVRRAGSLPALQIKELCSQMDSIEKEISSALSAYSSPKDNDESKNKLNQLIAQGNAAGLHRKSSIISEKSAIENCGCGFEQVEEIKEKVESSHTADIEEIMQEVVSSNDRLHNFMPVESMSARERYISLRRHSVSGDNSKFSSTGKVRFKTDADTVPNSFPQATDPKRLLDLDACSSSYEETTSSGYTTSSVNMQDIFEIPHPYTDLSEHQNLTSLKSILRDKGKHEQPDSILDSVDSSKNDEWLKKRKQSSYNGSKLSTPMKEIISSGVCQPVENLKNDSSPSRIVLEQFEKRLQKLEEDRITVLHENSDREELKLLREIQAQLNVMQSYIIDKKSKKGKTQDSSAYVSLVEAMLHFSI